MRTSSRGGRKAAVSKDGRKHCAEHHLSIAPFRLSSEEGIRSWHRLMARKHVSAVSNHDVARALPVLVHRLALLDERPHALGAIFQREGRMKQIAFDIHAFRQRG